MVTAAPSAAVAQKRSSTEPRPAASVNRFRVRTRPSKAGAKVQAAGTTVRLTGKKDKEDKDGAKVRFYYLIFGFIRDFTKWNTECESQ